MHTRFKIQASCLQVAESEIVTSAHMKNVAINMEKIQTIYSRLRPSVDDPGEDDELDAIEAELEAGLLSAGIGRWSKSHAPGMMNLFDRSEFYQSFGISSRVCDVSIEIWLHMEISPENNNQSCELSKLKPNCFPQPKPSSLPYHSYVGSQGGAEND